MVVKTAVKARRRMVELNIGIDFIPRVEVDDQMFENLRQLDGISVSAHAGVGMFRTCRSRIRLQLSPFM